MAEVRRGKFYDRWISLAHWLRITTSEHAIRYPFFWYFHSHSRWFTYFLSQSWWVSRSSAPKIQDRVPNPLGILQKFCFTLGPCSYAKLFTELCRAWTAKCGRHMPPLKLKCQPCHQSWPVIVQFKIPADTRGSSRDTFRRRQGALPGAPRNGLKYSETWPSSALFRAFDMTQMSQDQQFCRPYQRRVVSSSHMFPLLLWSFKCTWPMRKSKSATKTAGRTAASRSFAIGLGPIAWTKLHLPDPPNTLEVNPQAFGSKLQEIQIESDRYSTLGPCFWMVLPCRICRCRPRSSRRIGRLRSCAHANCRTFLGNQSSSCCWRSGNPMEPNGTQWNLTIYKKKVPFQWEEHVSWWFCQPCRLCYNVS